MHVAAVLVLELIQLTGLDHQVIEINPASVVSIRAPRSAEHFGPGIRCLIHMADGKIAAVIETCDEVRDLLQ